MESQRTEPARLSSIQGHQVLHSGVRVLAEQFPATDDQPDWEPVAELQELVNEMGSTVESVSRALSTVGRVYGTALHNVFEGITRAGKVFIATQPEVKPAIPTKIGDTNKTYGPQSKYNNPLSRKNNR